MESEKLWKKFSRAYREYKANKYEFTTCFTCGSHSHFTKMDTGHFIDRRHGAVKFNPLNVEIQCMACNRILKGNIDVYRKKLHEKYGPEVEDLLTNEVKSGAPMRQEEVEKAIAYFKTMKKVKNERPDI